MFAAEVRKKFFDYYQASGHALISSAPLIPENDPSTLFTGSGMQQLIPYLLGEKHPEGKRLVNSQKCFRAEDIDEVGDNRHTTFFEMLGNWSLGDYFKEEQLTGFFTFLVDELHLNPARLYVTVFAGDDKAGLPRDEESPKMWSRLFASKAVEAKEVIIGDPDNGSKVGMQGGRIFYYDASKNWWSRSGTPEKMPAGEPGGPDSEVFYEFIEVEHDRKFGAHCHPNCDCGRYMEIGNSVFMEYRKTEAGDFQKLEQRNVDFGGGLERMTAATLDDPDMFAVDVLARIIADIEAKGNGKVKYRTASVEQKSAFRIIADHLRASVFLIADGAAPSNKEQGYVTRRFLRRAIRYMDVVEMSVSSLHTVVSTVVASYHDSYPLLKQKQSEIEEAIRNEEIKFRQTLARGMTEFERLSRSGSEISGSDAFALFSTYGFPLEMTLELAKERGIEVDEKGFQNEFSKHQELSRTATSGTFKGGLADHSAETTRLHTATHLLHATLRKVLGDHVFQKGSNITSERLRFDFSHPEKMTDEELKKVEDMINDVVQRDLPVSWQEMTFEEAKAAGALGLFESKYGEKVKVYSIGDYSKEVCGGPHVNHTGEVGHFKIVKEEAVSAGVRRIKATVNGRNHQK